MTSQETLTVVPSETPRKFVNSGDGMLELIAIHRTGETIGEYLEK